MHCLLTLHKLPPITWSGLVFIICYYLFIWRTVYGGKIELSSPPRRGGRAGLGGHVLLQPASLKEFADGLFLHVLKFVSGNSSVTPAARQMAANSG